MPWLFALTFFMRLLLPIPNASPMVSLALMAPTAYPLRQSLLMIGLVLVGSDVALHYLLHYNVIGSWSFFVYSGWGFITLIGTQYARKPNTMRLIALTVFSALFFWAWTNFGTWCSTTIYPHNITGLLTCYEAAVPFLRNSLVSGVFWSVVFYYCDRIHIRSTVGAYSRHCI